MHVFRLIWVMISLRTLLIMSLALTFPALAGEVAGGPVAGGADVLEDTTPDMGPRSPEVAAGGEDASAGAQDQEPAAPVSQEPAVPLADAVNAAVGPEESIEICKLAVKSRFFPMYESRYRKIRITHNIKNPIPVSDYVSRMKKFQHMTPEQVSEMQDAHGC